MHLKNYLQPLWISEDTKLERYLRKFKTFKSRLTMINMPMVEEDLVEILLNVMFELYLLIQVINNTSINLSFKILMRILQHEKNHKFAYYNMKSSKNVLFIQYKRGTREALCVN